MEENYTKLGQDLEKFEAPVDEKGWETIANDPAVVRYRRARLLRSAAIYGSAALLVAAVVTAVVLLNSPAEKTPEAQEKPQQNMTQAIQESATVAEYEQETPEAEPAAEVQTIPVVTEVVKVPGSVATENPVMTSKVSAPVAEKPILAQSVQQTMPKSATKTVKSEQKTNNQTKSTASVSSSATEENSFSEKSEKYSEPDPEDDFKMYIPTAFTPNGDGLNDLFTISANFTPAQFECTIFSRRGERVFYSKSLDNSWDGTKNGSVMPQNVYVYLIKYVDPNGKPCVEKGQVTLLLN